LQQFLRIFEYVPILVPAAAQHFGGQLRRYLDARYRPIFRDIANFVDLDAGFSSERRFQLLGQLAWLVVSAGKRAHKSRKITLRCIGRKMNAGDSGSRQQLREALLGCGRTQGHAVQNDLITRSSQQQPRISAVIQSKAQFLPGGLELRRGPHVSKFIQPRKLQQNVQAVNKRARRLSGVAGHLCGVPSVSSLYTRPLCPSKTSLPVSTVTFLPTTVAYPLTPAPRGFASSGLRSLLETG